jgi:DNA-binding NarL/FixJ family response regulator
MLLAITAAARSSLLNARKVLSVNLVDKDVLLTDAIMAACDHAGDVHVSCSADNLEDGLMMLRRFQPELALVSGEIFCDGFREITEELRVRLGETRIAVFADNLTDSQLDRTLATPRVSGLMSKRCSMGELLHGCTRIAAGQFFVAPPLAERLNWEPGTEVPKVAARERLSRLTDRQLEVLVHLVAGDCVRDIAEKLQLSEKAVESHKFRIMARLGIDNRVQLCRWAIREGIVSA